jgi:hypothetical protein
MIGQLRAGRRIVGGAWGRYRGHWYRADEFGWLPARPGVHLLCCDTWESHAIPRLTLVFLAVIAALRALVSPADAAALLKPASRYKPYPVDPDDPVIPSRHSEPRS